MTSCPVILGFDTSGPWCAAALLVGEAVQDVYVDKMTRGQAEQLMPMLEAMLDDAGWSWSELSAIAVGTGPGNFTGIRIGVSAARGLSMGLGIPAIGVNGFDARQACLPPGTAFGIPAPRDQIYVSDPSPRLVAASDAPGRVVDTPVSDLVTAIARVAAARPDIGPPAPPVPFYIRPADAAPASDVPPEILD